MTGNDSPLISKTNMTGNDSPLISIVIPTYERPEYLDGAIKTAIRQLCNKIEIIVVDDGSSEQYAERTVDNFQECVRLIRHEENKGLSAARNTGIRESDGEYVAFLDDDDRWHRSKLARQVSALEQDETAGLATCLVAALTPDNELMHCETSAPSGDCSKELLIGNQIGTPSRVLVRQECFAKIGMFDESLPTKQDWDFYLRLCQEWNVAAVEDHLCFRTVHDSMSSSPESARRDNTAILKKHEEFLRSEGYWNQARAEIAERVGRAHLGKQDLKNARKSFQQALQKEPTVLRALLYILTLTHPKILNKLRELKRRVSVSKSGCPSQKIKNEFQANTR